MNENRFCKNCGSGPVERVIEGWGAKGEYIYLTCRCGHEVWDARPLSSSEEGNWPDTLDGEKVSAGSVKGADENLPLPYLRTVAAAPEHLPMGRWLALRVALPATLTSILIAVAGWAAMHWKPSGPSMLI